MVFTRLAAKPSAAETNGAIQEPSGASDIPLWIEFVDGCVDALLRSDPHRLRQACRVFLIQTA
jgi:hypothetical protein